MSKQAVEHDGKVVIVDTETGTFTEAKPDSRDAAMKAVGSVVDGVVGGALGTVESALDAVFGGHYKK